MIIKKRLLEAIPFVLLISVFALAASYVTDQYPFSHKAQHKVGEYFEYWILGDEFTKPSLFKIGAIEKVGKEKYLLSFYYCNLIVKGQEQNTTESIGYFDKSESYRVVSGDKLVLDIANECKPTK